MEEPPAIVYTYIIQRCYLHASGGGEALFLCQGRGVRGLEFVFSFYLKRLVHFNCESNLYLTFLLDHNTINKLR
jgi:hypothetical protein